MGWAACAALGLATHYFVAFVLLGELVWLWRAAPRDRRLAAAVGLVAVVGGALVPLAITQRAQPVTPTTSRTRASAPRSCQIPKQLLLGYASPHQALTAGLAALLLLVGAVVPLALSAPVRARAAWPLATGLVAVLVPVVLAVCGVDFLDTRDLLPALPPLLIAAGIGFAGWGELAVESRRREWRTAGIWQPARWRSSRLWWCCSSIPTRAISGTTGAAWRASSGLTPARGCCSSSRRRARSRCRCTCRSTRPDDAGRGAPARCRRRSRERPRRRDQYAAAGDGAAARAAGLHADGRHVRLAPTRCCATPARSPVTVSPSLAGAPWLGQAGYGALVQEGTG